MGCARGRKETGEDVSYEEGVIVYLGLLVWLLYGKSKLTRRE